MSAQHLRLRPTMRVEGGDPNAPRGEPPFRPLNPWGRGFPTLPRPDKSDLCQVVVKARGKELRVGPMMARECAEYFRMTIAQQIALGRERVWTNPVVVSSAPAMGRPVFME